MEIDANQQFKEVSISAVVHRLDGTTEDLGVIAKTTFDENGNPTNEIGKVEIIEPDSFLKRVLKKWRLL